MKLRKYVIFITVHALVIFVICFFGFKCLPDYIRIPRIDFLLNTSITCACTFSGFTLTVVSILLSFSRSALLEYLNENGGTKELMFRYTMSLILGLVLIMFCALLGSILPEDQLLTKPYVVIGAILMVLYLYNLISSGAYLLHTIALAASPTVQESDEVVTPTGNYRVG